jgi:hypothetical protein
MHWEGAEKAISALEIGPGDEVGCRLAGSLREGWCATIFDSMKERSSRYYSRCGSCEPIKSTNGRTEKCYTLQSINTSGN